MISPQPQGGSGYNDLAAEKKMAVTLEKNLHHDHASDYVTYDHVAETIVEMGHRMLEDESADVWEVASGIMAGAIQFWLYSRQPCEDVFCQACADISNPDRRLAALLREARAVAEESDNYCSVNDVTTGTA